MAPITDDFLPINAPPGFHLLAKPSGSTCNIDCTYCFFLSKESLYPNEKSRMSEATLETYIRQPRHLSQRMDRGDATQDAVAAHRRENPGI